MVLNKPLEKNNNTLIQRCYYLVRKGFYFLKFFNYEETILYFVHQCNNKELLNKKLNRASLINI